MALTTLLTAPMETDCESVVMLELGELAGWCRRFADSDCCDTNAFRTIVRRAGELHGQIPPACTPLGTLVYWVLVLFKTRPTDLDRDGVRAIAGALRSVKSLWMGSDDLNRIRGQWREAGVDVRPF